MKIETNITELSENLDNYFLNSEKLINADEFVKHEFGTPKGFTIGRGKKLYHIITVSGYGFYYSYPMDDNGMLGWRRQIETGTKVTVHY